MKQKSTPYQLVRLLRMVAEDYHPDNGRHVLLIDAATMIENLNMGRRTAITSLDVAIDQVERILGEI